MIRRDPRRRRPRFGFTLIELLVVIVIIGILISLLLPVIIAAVRKAHEAQVSADIQTIATGLAKFKDTYGEFPPSRVILSENGVYSLQGTFPAPQAADYQTLLTAMPIMNGPGSTTNLTAAQIGNPDVSFGTLAERSLRALRQFFTRASLVPTTQPGGAPYFPDYNGNGIQDAGYLYLEGDECLTFFLGGIPNPTTNANGKISFGMTGFGKEPLFPFKNAGVISGGMSTTNRTLSSYEFKPDRLIDDDGDGIPGYLDPNASSGVGTFYAYFAAYGSTGYDPNDVNFGSGGDITVGNTFRIQLPTFPLVVPPDTFSPAPNPYTSTVPSPLSPNQPASYISANSFQIISSGGDGLFGPGGQWTSNGDRLPDPTGSGARGPEADNVSSFTSGRLN